MRILSVGASVGVLILAVASCGKVIPKLESGALCSLNSECNAPLVCNFERCRPECKASRDCDGKLCVRGDRGGSVCQLDDEVKCTHHSQCAGKQECGPDGRCRDACEADKDCVLGTVCVANVCAKPDELVGGKLPERFKGTNGVACTYASDCPGDLVCLHGSCDVECLGDKDCVLGWVCRTQASGADGRCHPAASPEASSPAAFSAPLAMGNGSSCAVLVGGRLKCWGGNAYGELGLGDTANRGDAPGEMGDALPFVDVGTNRRVQAIVAGLQVTCGLLDAAQLKCWGSNTNGALGTGDLVSRGVGAGQMGDALPPIDLGAGRAVKSLVVGYGHVCAVLDNAKLKCWGRNEYGELGLGDTAHRGGLPGEMGDALPYVPLGTGRSVIAVAAGYGHTCAVLDNERVKCWGQSDRGTLGLGGNENRGDGPGEMGDALPYVDLGTGRTVKALSANARTTCALLDNGRVKCWGYNTEGGLGLGDSADRGDGPGEMGDALPYVDLGTGRTAQSIAVGLNFACALLDNGRVKCWGSNTNGALGLGDNENRGDAPGEMGDALPYVELGAGRTVTSIAAGFLSACAVLDNDGVKCWGQNIYGGLGLGDLINRGDLPNQMGDSLPFVKLIGP